MKPENRIERFTTHWQKQYTHEPYYNARYGWDDFEWLTVNAMKSAFAPFDERLRLINGRIKPGYALLKAEYAGVSAGR